MPDKNKAKPRPGCFGAPPVDDSTYQQLRRELSAELTAEAARAAREAVESCRAELADWLSQEVKALAQLRHEVCSELDAFRQELQEIRAVRRPPWVNWLPWLPCGAAAAPSAGARSGPPLPPPAISPIGTEAAVGNGFSCQATGSGKLGSLNVNDAIAQHGSALEASRPPAEDPIPAAVSAAALDGPGLLPPVLARWCPAATWKAGGRLEALQQAPFIDGIEAVAGVLDAVGGSMGSYLLTNTKKMRASQASSSEGEYRSWLASELRVHGATKFREYVDESAWMANLWIGWTLEFFVELFGHIHEGKETKASVDLAYKETLYNHHNMLQRAAFSAAVKKMPAREHILQRLRGEGASAQDVMRDIGAFVAIGRPIVQFCLEANLEMEGLLKREREALSRSGSSSRR